MKPAAINLKIHQSFGRTSNSPTWPIANSVVPIDDSLPLLLPQFPDQLRRPHGLVDDGNQLAFQIDIVGATRTQAFKRVFRRHSDSIEWLVQIVREIRRFRIFHVCGPTIARITASSCCSGSGFGRVATAEVSSHWALSKAFSSPEMKMMERLWSRFEATSAIRMPSHLGMLISVTSTLACLWARVAIAS